MPVVSVPLVPPGRLAALLISRRTERGLDVVALSALSRGAFSPSYLDAVERGALQLDEESLRAIVSLYELEAGPIVPDRSALLLDLDRGLVGVGETALTLPSHTTNDVLKRYVSLLYLLRGETPGKQLTLREKDLQVLEHSLGRDQQQLADELFALMGEGATEERTSLLSRRTVVIGAGLLVGATAVGSLVIVSSGGSTDAIDGASPARTEILAPQSSSGAITATFASSTTAVGSTQVSATPVSARAVQVVSATATTPVTADATTGLAAETLETETAETLAAASQMVNEPAAAPAIPEIVIPQAEPTVAPAAAAPAAAAAEPTAAPAQSTADSYAELGAAAEALVGYDFRAALPGWSISYAGDSAHFHGLTNSHQKTIVVYIEAGDTAYSVAEVLMHEVGHAIDVEHLDDSVRRQWIELRNMPSVWWAGDGLSDFAVGAGDFAEAVAAVTTGSQSNSVYGAFTAEQLTFAQAQLP